MCDAREQRKKNQQQQRRATRQKEQQQKELKRYYKQNILYTEFKLNTHSTMLRRNNKKCSREKVNPTEEMEVIVKWTKKTTV